MNSTMTSTVQFPYALDMCKISGGNPCEACCSLAAMNAKFDNSSDDQPHSANDVNDRYKLLSKVNERHDPMAYRLPIEITSKIFQYVLPDIPPLDHILDWPEEGDEDIGTLLPRTRLILTSICKNWRNIAHVTPQLYNYVFLNLHEDKSEVQMATILSDVERTLERSGGLPLLIRLQIDDYCNIAHSCVLPIMELLCKQVHRWQMLCISGPMEIISSISRYTSVVDCGSPLLSSLILTGVKTGDESENDVFVSIGSPTAPLPAPSYISTWGIKISPETWNFAHLRDLTLGVSALFELVQILAISPRLTSLTSSISCSHSNPTNAPAMLSSRERVLDFSIVNLHMKSWQVHIDYHGLFPRCTFPALEDLDCNIYPGPFTPGLRDFLARSQCPLTTMRLIIKCEEAEFIEILHLIPTLRDLDITSNNISSHFFQYLGETAIRSENGPDFLPNLETFQFQANQVSGLAFNWSLFRIMLPATTSAKGSKCRPLSKVTVHMHRSQVGNLTPAVQADLASVIDDGLEIVGNYMYGDSGFNLLESLDPLQPALSRLRGSRR